MVLYGTVVVYGLHLLKHACPSSALRLGYTPKLQLGDNKCSMIYFKLSYFALRHPSGAATHSTTCLTPPPVFLGADTGSHCWSWASENWKSLDGTWDVVAIGCCLVISLLAIAAGAQQAVKRGSSFSFASAASIVQVCCKLALML